jgi:glycosyltransferase involved in cell wall biosynthesis
VLNTDGQEWLRDKWGRIGKAAFRSAARVAPHAASALIADSNGMRRVYLDASGVESTVIPYPVPHAYANAIDESVLDRWGLTSGHYAVTAGRLVPENNADRIVEAYARSAVSMPLLVLGEANYESPVVKRIQTIASGPADIRVVGHINDRATYLTLVSRAAAYIHGHSVGGINPSLIEAMGYGSLILAYDTVFNREALGDTGLFFEDFDSLIPLLRQLPQVAPNNGDALRDKAIQRANDCFRSDQIADAYEAVLVATAASSAWRRTSIATQWMPSSG